MKYTVVWRRSAENELMRIWMATADRNAVSQASDQIDHLLRVSAKVRGNDVAGVYRLTIAPLSVVYLVSPDDCKVTVARVRYSS